ncbi:hypothetical protein QN360_19205, partial [Glaciimonas sp. CA11.2]
VLFGAGLAQFFFTSPIPVVKSVLATQPIQFMSNKLGGGVEASKLLPRNTQTLAQSMLDVD